MTQTEPCLSVIKVALYYHTQTHSAWETWQCMWFQIDPEPRASNIIYKNTMNLKILLL